MSKRKEEKKAIGRVRLTRGEKKKLEGLKGTVGYSKKTREEQERMLPDLIDLVKKNSERRDTEKTFAHNVSVASKHDKRIRFKQRWKFYTFLVTALLMIILFGFVLYSYVFVVEDIVVTGTDRYDPDEIIKVSGISVGDKLFSGAIDEDEIGDMIVRYFPYVKSVEVNKKIPSTVEIVLITDEAVFVSEIYGEWALISAELRVLEIMEEKPTGDYIKLTLPPLKSAVEGQILEFRDDMLKVALTAAKAVTSPSMIEEVSVLNISDRFSIYVSYGGRFKLMLGDITDVELKLTLAEKIMQDEIFAGGNKGTIYLENVNSPSAIIDNELNLE